MRSVLPFTAVLLWASLSVLATPLVARARPDLYRSGNAGGPGFDKAREGTDVHPDHGKVKPPKDGVSTDSNVKNLKGRKHLWRLAASAALPAGLQAINDHGSHWLIAPTGEMTLDTFKGHLKALNSLATKVASKKRASTDLDSDFAFEGVELEDDSESMNDLD